VIAAKDISDTIYEVPLNLRSGGLDGIVLEKFGMDGRKGDLSKWEQIVDKLKSAKETLNIAVSGKYTELHDAYKSIYEALVHGAIENNVKLNIVKVKVENVTEENLEEIFRGIHGILVPGGFGERGIEGKILTAKHARTRRIPIFGICLGMQCMVIEFARNVLGLKNANSTEFDIETESPVISLMEEQNGLVNLGGTMRLGSQPALLKRGTNIHGAYGVERISERHRHRYEFTNRYREVMEENGLVISATSPDATLVEAVEYKDHLWGIGVQFHPEFKSKPVKAHELFREFIRHGLQYKKNLEPHPKLQAQVK
jgi:CTP synthase